MRRFLSRMGSQTGQGVTSPSLAASPPHHAVLHDVTLERGWTPETLTAQAVAAGGPVWLKGDELTLFYHGAAAGVRVCCGIQMDMHGLPNSDAWALTVKNPELPRAIVTYSFIPDERFPIGEPMTVWRGPLAPPALAPVQVLQGTVRVEQLRSVALGEAREVTIYLPPGHSAARRYPVIYAADGESAGGMARTIEPLILSGALPPLLIVGAHSGEDELRAKEYIPENEPARFAAHERFFVEELATWAEWELGATTAREQRAVFGFSNGGVFAGEMLLRHPARFGVAMPLSAGIPPDTQRTPPDGTVRTYLAAGLFEEGFYRTTRAFAVQLERAGAQVVFNARAAGHDYAMWEEEFVVATRWAFGV